MRQGLFLKVVLADNLAPIVDEGFAMDPALLSGIDVLTLAFLFGFQIYFDFAAYSHIALGTALVLGIRIPENFNYPYIATSLREFWKRWHISLSSLDSRLPLPAPDRGQGDPIHRKRGNR